MGHDLRTEYKILLGQSLTLWTETKGVHRVDGLKDQTFSLKSYYFRHLPLSRLLIRLLSYLPPSLGRVLLGNTREDRKGLITFLKLA